MAGTLGSTSRSGQRPPTSGGGSRDAGLRLLASFPDLEQVGTERVVPAVPVGDEECHRAKPRIGWGSIAILAVVAFAACTAAWWIDRGPIDPATAEIARAKIAEDGAAKPASPVRTVTKIKKGARR